MYVHLIEPTTTPERAEKAADTLLTLMPAAGHMVHMPSHIYQRVGRYADAMESNRLAVAADEDYIAQCRAQGLYPMGYYPHNVHFLWFAATADGQSKVATDAARKVASRVEEAQLAQLPMLAGFRVVPYWAHVRFGRWQEMLAEPEPPAGSRVPARRVALRARPGVRRHGRRRRRRARARRTRRSRCRTRASTSRCSRRTPDARILSIGVPVLAGEIAAARGDFPNAIARLEEAVRLEDALVYTEPSEWHSPPRLALGAILLEAGRPAEAETVYWEDLRRATRQRLGALRRRPGPARPGQGRPGRDRRGSLQEGMGTRRHHADRVALRADPPPRRAPPHADRAHALASSTGQVRARARVRRARSAVRATPIGGSGLRPRSSSPTDMFVCRESAASRSSRREGSGAFISARYLRVNIAHALSSSACWPIATRPSLGASIGIHTS